VTPSCQRSGHLPGAWLAFLASAGVLAVLVGLLAWHPEQTDPTVQPLLVYCAAGMKLPVESSARAYEEEYGVPVQLQFGGSQTLLANVEVSNQGDLYIPADDEYLDKARARNLLSEVIPLARLSAVVAVRKGQAETASLTEMLRAKTTFAQANPDAAAIGKVTRDHLRKQGLWDSLHQATVVYKPTVVDVANDVKVGTVRAGIIWDALALQYPDLELRTVPELSKATATVSVSVLRSSSQPTAALRFARYLAARDRGAQHFKQHGFQAIAGDPWAIKPEIRLLAGAMLRPAIEDTLDAFAAREGVKVTRVYNGCGILVAQMKAGERPDAYFACDKSFMTQVHDLFLDPHDVSTNQLVMLVPRGNPHRIHDLRDLGKPGLRIGVGHEQQCALGVLTQETLKQGGQLSPVMKNVKVQSPTGDMLVNQLRTGSLDAVIAYISNAASAGDELEAMEIDVPCARATQPFAVGKESQYRQLTGRLMDALHSRASREQFESLGFGWQKVP
jgi:molybdenum ABC transporter molybdate-binding protein